MGAALQLRFECDWSESDRSRRLMLLIPLLAASLVHRVAPPTFACCCMKTSFPKAVRCAFISRRNAPTICARPAALLAEAADIEDGEVEGGEWSQERMRVRVRMR